MRAWILPAVLALLASTALAACGNSTQTDPSTTTPLRFTPTQTAVTTTTVPIPTAVSYIGPEAVAIETGRFLASDATTRLGRTVDGIQCQRFQQLAYHLYAHLEVYVRGLPRAIPGGVGLVDPVAAVTRRGLIFSPQTCYYWLHTRAADGVVQVQSPAARRFTLGNFFRVWDQPLGSHRVAAYRGRVTAIVDGRLWRGDPARIPLREHESIELAVGRPVPRFRAIDWAGTGF